MYTRVPSESADAYAVMGTHEVLMHLTSERDVDETAGSTVFESLD